MAPPHCITCFKPYSSSFERIPKFILCGHTICSNCLQDILNNSRTCPICRREFQRNAQIGTFPTNSAILEIVEVSEKKSYEILEASEVKKNAQIKWMSNAQGKLSRIRDDLYFLHLLAESNLNDKIVSINATKIVLSKLEGVKNEAEYLTIADDFEDSDIFEVKMQFEVLRKKLLEGELNKAGDNVITENSMDISKVKKLSEFIIMIKYETENGKTFKVLKERKCKLYSGKVSLEGDEVLLHAFEPGAIEREIQNLSFQELKSKKWLGKKGFLEFENEELNWKGKIFFDMHKTDCNTSVQFIQLCIGENGQTFKGKTLNHHHRTVSVTLDSNKIDSNLSYYSVGRQSATEFLIRLDGNINIGYGDKWLQTATFWYNSKNWKYIMENNPTKDFLVSDCGLVM